MSDQSIFLVLVVSDEQPEEQNLHMSSTSDDQEDVMVFFLITPADLLVN